MTQITRYIFRHLFWWAVLVTATLTCVVWLTQSLRFVKLIVNHGLSVPAFVWLTSLLLPTFLLIILPIAAFSAILFTYSKLISDSEMVVLRGAGLSQWGLARPAMLLAALVTVICYGLSLYLLPLSFREFKDLERKHRSSYSSVLLQEGVFNPVMKGVTVYVRERKSSGELLGIVVHDRRKPKTPVTMMAERGAILPGERGPRVLMEKGNRQELRSRDGQLSLLNFERYVFDVLDETKIAPGDLWRDPHERFLHELLAPTNQSLSKRQRYKYMAEAHYRLTAPILGLTLVLVGVAFLLGGQFNRRGQWRRILGAIVTVLAIEAAMVTMQNMSVKSPNMAFAMYLFALAPVVVSLYTLAMRPRRQRVAAKRAPA